MATPTFDPANFTKEQAINNPFLPYKPGTTFVYDTFAADGSLEQVDTQTVLDKTVKIDGVTCTVVLDVAKDATTGQPIEKTKDYFAQDKSGNVWYFGEAATQYENGKPVSTDGSWRAGVNSARPGIVMEAHPQIGDSYDQENAPGIAQDHAEVLKLNGSATVPFGSFKHNLLVTHEDSTLEPGASETKSYAAGVGQVYGKDLVTGEVDKLVSVTTDDSVTRLVQAMAGFGSGGGPLNSDLSGQASLADQHAWLANSHHHT